MDSFTDTTTNKLQQQPFYGPLIQDNLGEPVLETMGSYHHYPPQYL